MAVICPTVTARNTHQYREQLERVSAFASRIHFDFADGQLAPVELIELSQAWLPEGKITDLHLMFQNPKTQLDQAIKLKPFLVIVHAEADGNFVELAEKLHDNHIKAGVALLQKTDVSLIEPALDVIDHVLVFSGDLGHFGGRADLSLLEKVKKLKQLKPSLEIGWDGGINEENIQQLVDGGVDVLNVGGYIQHAEAPDKAYATLESKITSGPNAEIKP